MTREEAIEFGKMWLELQEDYKDSNTYEFFKMAIEVLQQEPCEDVVSRSKIKKIAKEMYLEVANMELDASTISDCISYTSSKCREVLESKLQALPSVKTQEPIHDKPHIKGNYYDGFKNGLRTAKWRYDKIRTEIKQLPITDTAIRLVDEIFDEYMKESENEG